MEPLSDTCRTLEERTQEAFLRYRTRCFWWMRPDARPALASVVRGLKLHGGVDGWRLGRELEMAAEDKG